MNNDTDTDMTAAMNDATARRIAALRADAARPVIMPDRPTDTSRNRMRGSRPTQKRRIIR